MNKPIVHFAVEPEFFDYITFECARVYALDHPRLGHGWVVTSMVLNKFEDGSFETRNTMYVPAPQPEEEENDTSNC